MTNNLEIKILLKSKCIPYWRVSDELGLSEGHFCRLLRKPVSEDFYAKVIEAVKKVEGVR